MGVAAARANSSPDSPGPIAFLRTVCTILPKYAHVHIAAAFCRFRDVPKEVNMGRIKMFAMGVRRRDMSPEDFHDYWRHPHGTWGRKMSTLRGYVQSHQVHTEHLGPGQAEYECVAELWLDNERDVQGFQQEPIYAKYLHDDASNFCDYSKAIYFATQE